MDARGELLDLIREVAIVRGRVTLSSGQEADYYIDLRRVGLSGRGAPLVGQVMRDLTADWSYDAVGGLTLGADPVAGAIMHASDGAVDAFVVRKTEKQHGLQRRIEGPEIAGRSVLIVEDTSTTGSSPLTAIAAAQDAGAQVVGAALIVDRGGAAAIEDAGWACRCAYSLADLGLA